MRDTKNIIKGYKASAYWSSYFGYQIWLTLLEILSLAGQPFLGLETWFHSKLLAEGYLKVHNDLNVSGCDYLDG